MATPQARGVIYIHSAPRALCPHLEWAVGRALGRGGELRLGRAAGPQRQPPRGVLLGGHGRHRRGARDRDPRLGAPALRGDRRPDAAQRRRPLAAHAGARHPLRPDRLRRQRRHRRGPHPLRDGGRRGRRRSSSSASCRSRWARRGTTSSSRSATRATTRRSSGSTRSADRSSADAGARGAHYADRTQTQAARGAITGGRRTNPGAGNANHRLTKTPPVASSARGRLRVTLRRSDGAERDDGVVPAEAERVADRELRPVAERDGRAGDAQAGSRDPASSG